MTKTSPPRLPGTQRGASFLRPNRIVVLVAIPATLIGALVLLRLCGLLIPFSIPTSAMSPAVSPGDAVLMEGFTYLSREPRRGDIAVFRTKGIPSVQLGSVYTKRVVGEPGDHLRIEAGRLFVNDALVTLSNAAGPITYVNPTVFATNCEVIVPAGCYYLLGDNTTNSYDSRYWGALPRENIIGRISFCYWPLGRAGEIK